MINPIKTIRLFALKIKRANYGRVFKRAVEIGKRVQKPAVLILIDMLWCVMRYGAAFPDYDIFGFYGLSAKERGRFLTMNGNNKLVAYMNDRKYRHFLEVKTDLVKRYREFLHREVLILGEASRDDTVSFIKRNSVFFAKKNYTFAAQGIARFALSDFENENDLYNRVLGEGFDLIEEPISQHSKLAELFPGSVNTLRIFTVFVNGKCDIVFAALKTGNKSFVDNMNAGGLSAAVDIDTGIVYTDAVVKGGERYESHPATNVTFKGFQIPMWESVLELVNRVVGVTPELRFVGWDIAITDEGPALVEGNYLPSYDLLQLPDMKGRKWILEKYVR